MLRFPNPGSDMSAFVRTFQALFRVLRTRLDFSLDDISGALVASGLATSSGYIGQEALRRSTRPDRSLDPLFNQSKMYSELLRILGWIHPLKTSRQRFTFSFLGSHVGLADFEPTLLVKECLLGIAYPNPLVVIKGSNFVRPIALILSIAAALEGRITRDEIILGPFDIDDDRRAESIGEMIEKLRSLRQDPNSVQEALRAKSTELGIQVNTLHNYTRFPLGVLRWAGWSRRVRDSVLFHVLTSEGMELVDRIKNSYDIRARDLTNYQTDEIDSFLQVAVYRMFERAGYSIATQELEAHEYRCRNVLRALGIDDTRRILFSPFQEYSPQDMARVFPSLKGDETSEVSQVSSPAYSRDYPERGRISYVGLQPVSYKTVANELQSDIIDRICYYLQSEELGLDEAVKAVAAEYIDSSKDRFYPAVETIFRYLGYQCELSRVGVNYQRMDALIKHPTHSIPIEIKSPGEEEFISVKGVRQALENKVVLVARKYAPTQWETTTLLIGFELPADRSDVLNLVDDIYVAYNVSVGIIDFGSLIRLAAIEILQDRKPKDEDLFALRGILAISDS
jgi:hypothetical protein